MTYILIFLCVLLGLILTWALRSRTQLTALNHDLLSQKNRAQKKLEEYTKEHKAQLERLERESTQRVQRAHLPLSKAMFEPLDNLERAKTLIPGEMEELQKGIEMTHASFLQALEKHNVTPIQPEANAPFDPKHHEAISATTSPKVDSQQVLDTLRTGWQHGEDILRPAMVQVVKPEVQTKPAAPIDPQDDEPVTFDFEANQEEPEEHVVEHTAEQHVK